MDDGWLVVELLDDGLLEEELLDGFDIEDELDDDGWFVPLELDEGVLLALVDGVDDEDDCVELVSCEGLAEELLLALPLPLTPSAARVWLSSEPDALMPFCCWNFSSAACVFGPITPSALPTSKPWLFRASWACFTVAESWLPDAALVEPCELLPWELLPWLALE